MECTYNLKQERRTQGATLQGSGVPGIRWFPLLIQRLLLQFESVDNVYNDNAWKLLDT